MDALLRTAEGVVVAERVHKTYLPALLEPVVRQYRDERVTDEGFGDFVSRAGITTLAYTPSVPVRATREPVPA